jgi:PAS domain S-box-containing protein
MGTATQPILESRQARVLIAEGDKISLTHVRTLLSKSGYDVTVARDGLHALELLESENPPTLAVLDWTMPGLNGIEICRRLRSGKQRRSTHVILLTSWNQQKERVEALEAGADDCLYKPVDVRELRIRLQIGAQNILARALRESEERFRSAFECAGIGMAVLKTTGEFLQVSRVFCELLGYTSEEFLAMNFHAIASFPEPPTSQALLQQFLEEGLRSREFERNFVTKSGRAVCTSSTISVVLDSDERPTCFVLQVQDVTERKAAEEALRRSEGLLRAINDNLPDLIIVVDTEQRWKYVNPASLEILGYTPAELMGTNAWATIHPEDGATVAEAVEEVASGKPGRMIQFRWRHKDGRWRHMESQASLLRSPNGAIEGSVLVARRIDDRLLAQQKLQAAYAETELFLRSIPSILIGLDTQGRITRWNLTAATTFGLDASDVLGRSIEGCGIKWSHPDMKAEVANWLSTNTSHRCDDLAYEHDGKTRFLSLEVRSISLEESERAGFIVTGADSTQRKGLEEQLRQAQKLEAIGQLAAGIAHEINTPTQYVSDNIRFLKDSWGAAAEFLDFCGTMRLEAEAGGISQESLEKFQPLYEKADFEYLLKEFPRALDQSLEGLQRVAKIVRGMKEFSHPGSKEKRAVNLNQAIESTITVTRNEWKYCAEVVTAFDEALPLVACLVGEFNQVVLNLIINATHAIAGALGEDSSEKGTITITTRRQENWAEITVADTGPGIPDEIRSRIFEPFFTTKAVGKGTGQGLALAHSVIVNLHQGQIWFDTEVGKGTTFFLRLPLDTGVAVT